MAEGQRSSRARRGAVVMTVAVAFLSACSGTPTAEDDAQPTPTPTPLEVVWESEGHVVSGPVAVGGALVFQTTAGDALFMVGVDPESGDELWSQEASPGEVVTGIEMTTAVVSDHPVYFRPSPVGNLYAELVVADPTTGEDVVTTEPMLFMSRPEACEDDPSAVCVDARKDGDSQRSSFRVDVDGDGALIADEGLKGRSIGDHGLRELRDGSVEYIARFEDGKELWRRDVADVFGPGYSSNFGWRWDYDASTDRFYGDLGHEVLPPDDEGKQVIDLADSTLAALDAATGDVVWSDPGDEYLCIGDRLDVPAGDQPESEGAAPLPVVCRMEGTLNFPADPAPTQKGIGITIEGFDRDSGEATWTVDAGDTQQLLGGWVDAPPVPRLGGTAVVLELDGAPTVLDLATGETRDYAGETLWCTAGSEEFRYREPYYYKGDPKYDRLSGDLYQPCTVTGEPLTGDVPTTFTEVPAEMSTTVGDLVVVGTPDGVVAYR